MAINYLPFSYAGSYMVISEMGDQFGGQNQQPGIYLRTVHGLAKHSGIARLYPIHEGKEVPCMAKMTASELTLTFDGGSIHCCFIDDRSMFFRVR
ncbi:MAG: hypothetical protein GX096_02430 [Clostridiales bacterium]|nr:hypothetical protein [Clostridiales bacterium]